DSDGDGIADCADLCPFGDLILNTNSVNTVCGNDGSASVAVVGGGGSGSYSYLWSNGGTAASINNIFSGNYFVTVTDNVYGCTEITMVSVLPSQGSFAISNVDTTHVSC